MTTSQPLNLWPDDRRWPQPPDDTEHADPEYAQLLAELRRLQDVLAGAAPPPADAGHAAALLAEAAELLAAHTVPEVERWDGRHRELPGRGLPLMPAYMIDEASDDDLRGRVTFGRIHLGRNGAVHGGVPPLLFDDILGRLSNHGDAAVSRTAYLTVNYRRIAPVGVELAFAATRTGIEGRKRWLSGHILTPDGEIACESEALFVTLHPGQA